MNVVISTWVLVTARMMFAFPLVYVRVKNHTEIDDETLLLPLCCLVLLLIISLTGCPSLNWPNVEARMMDLVRTYEHVFDFILVFRMFMVATWSRKYDMDDLVITN
ncbi:hypothetical protein BDR03DRAFT_294838 [Suillus americanus]|nr:hypothetical protein BDR03DRAFT_294838 [Suillus americanus]